MIVTTLIAATVAAAEPQAAPPAPVPPHADHKAGGQVGKKMACCENMAKGEGCACCKDMASAGKSDHESHGDHK